LKEKIKMISNSHENLKNQQPITENRVLLSGFHCLLQMPTGSGKTWLAEQAISTTLEGGRRAIYLTPLRAMAEELSNRWCERFSGSVGVFTGDTSQQSFQQSGRQTVQYSRAQLLVMTPEKLDVCTRHWRQHWSWIPEVDLLVVDELHLLGDDQRGARLEATVLRFLRLNPFARVIGLSATLGNRAELADWLGGIEYQHTHRPIPLEWRTVKYQQATSKPDLLLAELERVKADGHSLVFVQSRRRAETLAAHLREQGWRAEHHHAGLDRPARQSIEDRFRAGTIQVLIATPTLEMGLNLPVRQVVLYDLQRFSGADFVPLSVTSVWQRAGRAGRPGLDERGEVVLFAPTWDRHVDQYPLGQFEAIQSHLANPIFVAEQIVAEVASGLCLTDQHLETVFARTLAAHQGRLPVIADVLETMLEAGMLRRAENDSGRAQLRATPLGKIASRHLLAPETVLLFKRVLEAQPNPTLFDLLLLATGSGECEPSLPVDYEDLEALAGSLHDEPSTLLGLPQSELEVRLELRGKRLLSALHTALVLRDWVRSGDLEQTAESRNCYPFEVARLCDSVGRLLQAMQAVAHTLEATDQIDQPSPDDQDHVPLEERIRVLAQMVEVGINEAAVTLTALPGLGPVLARRLHDVGITDLETLADSDPKTLAAIQGISRKRATSWVKQAEQLAERYPVHRYKFFPTHHEVGTRTWPADIDPYRLKRALELRIDGHEGLVFRISGGNDPHEVRAHGQAYQCDCPDFAKGHTCKHILRVRLVREKQTLDTWVKRLHDNGYETLDLHALWMGTTRPNTRLEAHP
jgi:helicase